MLVKYNIKGKTTMKIAMVTGHRPQGLNKVMNYGDYDDIPFMEYVESMGYIVDKHLRDGYGLFISGGAIGVDLDFAEMVQHLRGTKYSHVKLEIAIPCDNQDLKWSLDDKQRYKEILADAEIITQVGHKYTSWCMQKRNEYMVDKADKVIAFWNGEEHGGTWNTIQYAKKRGKEIEIIDLRSL